MTEDDIIRMAREADLWLTSQERIEAVKRFAEYVEMATLIDIEKRIEALARQSDPVTQAGAMAVLRELRGEK